MELGHIRTDAVHARQIEVRIEWVKPQPAPIPRVGQDRARM